MTNDAQAHADEDQKNREKIEAKNKLDSLIYNTEKILKENRDKFSDSDASSVDSALSKAKQVLESSAEAAELNAAADELMRASHKLAEIMYQKTAGQNPPQEEPGKTSGPSDSGAKQGSGKKEDEVIDAEYVDMDKNE
jgi:molecular chaperone DnaK